MSDFGLQRVLSEAAQKAKLAREDKCPKCGAAIYTDRCGFYYTYYICGTELSNSSGKCIYVSMDCLRNQLAQRDETIERLRGIAAQLVKQKYAIQWGWSGKGKECGYYLNDKYVGTTPDNVIDALLAEAGKENSDEQNRLH